jgi:hypothetical protein
MNYAEQHAAHEAELERQTQSVNDKEQIYLLYCRRRDIVACEANSKLILNYFNGDPIENAAMLDDAIEHPALKARLAFQTPEQDRSKLEASITALLVGSPDAIQHERAKFKYKTVEELSEWHDRLKSRKEMQQKSPAELRQIIKPTVTAPRLPADYSRDTLLALAKSKISEFRALTKKYGNDAVNRRLNGEV